MSVWLMATSLLPSSSIQSASDVSNFHLINQLLGRQRRVPSQSEDNATGLFKEERAEDEDEPLVAESMNLSALERLNAVRRSHLKPTLSGSSSSTVGSQAHIPLEPLGITDQRLNYRDIWKDGLHLLVSCVYFMPEVAS
ncbi:unnamed protein product [Protopolystoma xenopodis]|uniref:Uncharacterized protein n=1 Tax=Protopolystoma xenopodis TaxID=117903 RepID=A0A3S5ASI8_9PLAT|nr:unnamed protein product [Protopolystoma xenopodis]